MIVQDESTKKILRDAGKIHRDIIAELLQTGLLTVGHTGLEIENWIIKIQKKYNVESAFLGQYGFPANIILSINDVVVHGIPHNHPFESGDVIKVDYGIRYKKLLTDAATTIIIDRSKNPLHDRCREVTKKALMNGIQYAKTNNRVGDIGSEIEKSVTREGFFIIRDLTGHGLGKEIHERPNIYNYGKPGKGDILSNGLYIAIEPIVGLTSGSIYETDNYAICMKDGNLGFQEEHCGIVGNEGFEIIV